MANPNPSPHKNSPYTPHYKTVSRSNVPRALSPAKAKGKKRVVLLAALSIVAALGTYTIAQYFSLKNNVIVARDGEASAILNYDPDSQSSRLDTNLFRQMGDGRFNVVIVGVGGENHPGGMLTDTIQVLSIDTINKKAGITSIPRDLYVSIPGSGKGKINTAYQIGEQNKKDGGASMVKSVVSSVIGAKVSNFVMLDFTGAKEVIDALGGVDVNVPTAINDPLFPDDKTVGYQPFYISAGLQHMNGTTALKYARSRETTSDFDRSARQQLIIAAAKKKALSLGVITNPVKINGIITALGRHMKTDLQPDEIKTVLNIYKDIPSENSTSQVLDTSQKLGLLTSTTDPTAGYISYPILGQNNFSDIHSWFGINNPDPLIAKERAKITVANGGKASAKQMDALVETMKEFGYDVTLSTEPPRSNPAKTEVFETRKGGQPITRNYLGSYFSVTPQDGSPLNSDADFELIYVPAPKK